MLVTSILTSTRRVWSAQLAASRRLGRCRPRPGPADTRLVPLEIEKGRPNRSTVMAGVRVVTTALATRWCAGALATNLGAMASSTYVRPRRPSAWPSGTGGPRADAMAVPRFVT